MKKNYVPSYSILSYLMISGGVRLSGAVLGKWVGLTREGSVPWESRGQVMYIFCIRCVPALAPAPRPPCKTLIPAVLLVLFFIACPLCIQPLPPSFPTPSVCLPRSKARLSLQASEKNVGKAARPLGRVAAARGACSRRRAVYHGAGSTSTFCLQERRGELNTWSRPGHLCFSSVSNSRYRFCSKHAAFPTNTGTMVLMSPFCCRVSTCDWPLTWFGVSRVFHPLSPPNKHINGSDEKKLVFSKYVPCGILCSTWSMVKKEQCCGPINLSYIAPTTSSLPPTTHAAPCAPYHSSLMPHPYQTTSFVRAGYVLAPTNNR